MHKLFLPFLIVLLFLAGCSQKEIIAPNQKVYAEEDLDILIAIEAAKAGDFDTSVDFFEKLYAQTNRIEYLKELVKLQIENGEYENARTNIQNATQQDMELQRLVVITYVRQNDYDNALKKAIENTKVSNQNIDYRLVSDIYLNMGEYENAYKYLQSAYAKEQSINNLMPMVRVLSSYLDKDADALAYMQTFLKSNGFDEQIYNQILAIHSKNENVAGMKSALEALYEQTKKVEYGQNILNIYSYLNDTQGAVSFLENSGFNDNLLFDLYKSMKHYSKALKLADARYEQTKQPFWLANIAILKYELDYPLDEIVQTFEDALSGGEDAPIYLNYYGYILIDHELDIKKGISLVQKALEQKPDSIYYIDSLAWGYYKLNQCDKAKALLPQIENDESKEIQEHVEKIKRCKE
jgi:tetratricopeptide (TPR) repeat protein